MSTNKLERLLKLIAVLLDTSMPLTAEDLRGSVEGYPENDASFHRAFERDKDEIREMGIPLRVERVPATDPPLDGYRIPPEEYYLADPGLTPDELAALHLAAMAVRLDPGDGPQAAAADQEALWKLGGQDEIFADEIDQVASVPVDPRLSRIFSAITNGQPISFLYRDEEREIEPGRLDFQRGRWYLTGFDRGREGERNFRLDRIDGDVRLVGDPGTARRRTSAPGTRVESWEMGDEEPIEITVRIDAQRAAWARRRLTNVVVERELDDGAIDVTMAVRNEEAFRSFVLDFLEHAEVLGPPDVRDRTIAWLESVA